MFYIVDKPVWISSNLVAKILKRVLDTDRVGFAWTLDPLASGIMIIGTHGSSRLFPYLEKHTKTYHVVIRFDGTTASYDLEQPVLPITLPKNIATILSESGIRAVVEKYFLWEIEQIPPEYSAIWIDGHRSYDRVRKGDIPVLKSKKRIVHNWNILDFSWPFLTANICVSHGTYIRSLARDLWKKLDVGGYLTSLKRTHIWPIGFESVNTWKQHNDIRYAELPHKTLFPDIPLLSLTSEEKTHLFIGSTPLKTSLSEGLYFMEENGIFGLLESKNWLLFPLKNKV